MHQGGETRSVGPHLNLHRLLGETDITFQKGPFNLSSPRFDTILNRMLGT